MGKSFSDFLGAQPRPYYEDKTMNKKQKDELVDRAHQLVCDLEQLTTEFDDPKLVEAYHHAYATLGSLEDIVSE